MKRLALLPLLLLAACGERPTAPAVTLREHVELLNAHAAVLAQAGDVDGAIAAARRVITLLEQDAAAQDPNLRMAYGNLAELLAAAGRGFEADAWARKALASAP